MPDTTDDGASDSWRKLMERIASEPVGTDTPDPPEWTTEHIDDAAYMASAGVSEDEAASTRPPITERPTHRLVSLPDLASKPIPEFPWWDRGWLSPHLTLMSGRGGVGKSLLALQIAVARAAGKPFLTRDAMPRQRVLYWACEDDLDEIHRRLHRICHAFDVSIGSLDGWLSIDVRLGLDNILLATEYNRPMWTPAYATLREQLNDLDTSLWIGDNIAHLFAASENDRASVTAFTAGISAARDVPYCPLLMGHVAKAQGSEYAGSTAWENAVRMRWFLGRKLPDQQDDDGEDDANTRVLAKRKSNYSADDIIQFRIQDGVLVRQEAADAADEAGGVVANIRRQNARQAVLKALGKLAEMGMVSSQSTGANYLPAQMQRFGLMGEYSKRDIMSAMDGLLTDGVIKRGTVGKDKASRDRFGLVISAGNGG